MDVNKEIGAKIRFYRKKKGLTVDQLAQIVHKSKSTISKYESGAIVMDILSLYDLAEALDVKVTQLLYLPLKDASSAPAGFVPAFFNGLNHVYMYYFDGRINDINRCVIDIAGQTQPGVYQIQMYMNVQDFEHYTLCENIYEGTMVHYDALTMMVLQNLGMEMDRYQIGVPSPYMNAPENGLLLLGFPAGL